VTKKILLAIKSILVKGVIHQAENLDVIIVGKFGVCQNKFFKNVKFKERFSGQRKAEANQ